MNKTFNFFLTLEKEKIISVNALYLAGLKRIGGRPIPYIYKNPKANIIETEIRNQLMALDWTEWVDFFKTTKYYSITISFILKSNLMKRDVQNLDKAIIDIFTKYVHDDLGITTFDDSLFLDVHFTKSIIPKASNEYIAIHIGESKHNPRFDIIETPENIYVQTDDLKDLFTKTLRAKNKGFEKEDKVKYKFFSDLEKKKECNTEILFLDPKEDKTRIGRVYARLGMMISDIVSSENKFLWIGILGSEGDWGRDCYSELKTWCDEINTLYLKDCSKVKIAFISDPIDILSSV